MENEEERISEINQSKHFRFKPVFLYITAFSASILCLMSFYLTIVYKIRYHWKFELLLPFGQYFSGILTGQQMDMVLYKYTSSWQIIINSALFNILSAVFLYIFQDMNDYSDWIMYNLGMGFLGIGLSCLSRKCSGFLKQEFNDEKTRKQILQIMILFGMGVAQLLSGSYINFFEGSNDSGYHKPNYIQIPIVLLSISHIGQLIETRNFKYADKKMNKSLNIKILDTILQIRVLMVQVSVQNSNIVTAFVQYSIIVDSHNSDQIVFAPGVMFFAFMALYYLILIMREKIYTIVSGRIIIVVGNVLVFVGCLLVYPFWNKQVNKINDTQQWIGYCLITFGGGLVNIYACNELQASSSKKFKVRLRYLRNKILRLFSVTSFIGSIIGTCLISCCPVYDLGDVYFVLWISSLVIAVISIYQGIQNIFWLIRKMKKSSVMAPSISIGTENLEDQSIESLIGNQDLEIQNDRFINKTLLYGKYFTIDNWATSSFYIH